MRFDTSFRGKCWIATVDSAESCNAAWPERRHGAAYTTGIAARLAAQAHPMTQIPAAQAAAPALSIRDLRKTYEGRIEALKGVSLEVAPGDFFALLGPNGAGKSTLIGIVSSLVNPTAGEVKIFGTDLVRERSAAMRLIGLVPQEINFNMFEKPLDILVNYAGFYGVPRAEALQRAEEELRRAQLWEKANVMSRTLSGGMKRRLMIARAMMTRPRLLILDEPTAGVDIEIRRGMWKTLKEINTAGTTIILTTHYLEEAESLCRHVAIIDRGRIVERGPMKTLLAKLDVEGFLLDIEGALPAALPAIEGATLVAIDDHTLDIEMPRAMDLNRVFAALGEAGICVRSMRTKSNRLEELFVRLTGDRALDESAQDGTAQVSPPLAT
jgi:ABC-2 type transport system ATP-binding protein